MIVSFPSIFITFLIVGLSLPPTFSCHTAHLSLCLFQSWPTCNVPDSSKSPKKVSLQLIYSCARAYVSCRCFTRKYTLLRKIFVVQYVEMTNGKSCTGMFFFKKCPFNLIIFNFLLKLLITRDTLKN